MDPCLAGGTLLVLAIFAMVSSLVHGVPVTMTTFVTAVLETQSQATVLIP
jgi:hypothetical protein